MRRGWRVAAPLLAVAAAAGMAAACSRVRIPPATGVSTRARSLPLAELPVADDSGRVFAIVLTGDGPTGGLGRRIGRELQAEGVPSAVWHSLRYFWRAKTPEQASRDLDLAIRHYAGRWGRDRVLLIGYSMGADVLPFQINRLPPETRARIAGVALLAMAHDAVFEFRIEQWWGTSGAPARATRPEVERLGDLTVLCIWAEGDDKAACPAMRTAPMREVRLRGGHHFSGDEARLMAVLRALADTAEAAAPR